MKRLYLDHNATSPLRPAAAAILREMSACPVPLNPGSVHREGQQARAVLERARRTLLHALHAPPGATLVWTGGATESNHLTLRATRGPVIAPPTEHPSVTRALEALDGEGRVLWRRWPVGTDGRLCPTSLQPLLAGAGLVVVSAANNELGTLAPLEAIGRMCLNAGVPLHVDAAQAFGRMPWRWWPGITSVALGAHKAGGPVGVGALAMAPGTGVSPDLPGGHQERGRRPGTQDVLGAAAWAAVVAADEVERWEACRPVRDAFETALVGAGAQLNASGEPRLPNTASVAFPGREAEELLMQLDLAGIAASAGSACTAGSIDPSPVLLALGLPEARVRGTVRFSFGPEHGGLDGAAIAERVLDALAWTADRAHDG